MWSALQLKRCHYPWFREEKSRWKREKIDSKATWDSDRNMIRTTVTTNRCTKRGNRVDMPPADHKLHNLSQFGYFITHEALETWLAVAKSSLWFHTCGLSSGNTEKRAHLHLRAALDKPRLPWKHFRDFQIVGLRNTNGSLHGITSQRGTVLLWRLQINI